MWTNFRICNRWYIDWRKLCQLPGWTKIFIPDKVLLLEFFIIWPLSQWQINKERDDGVTAGIELVGTEEAQMAAHQMIKDVVASSGQSGGRGQYL